MTRQFPERNPEWLTNNDWSAESRLKWVQTLLKDEDDRSPFRTYWYYRTGEKYTNRVAIFHLINYDDKQDCEDCWNLWVSSFDSDNKRRNKPKDLDVVLEMLNNNKSITEIAQHFNVQELTVKRWIKQIKLDL